jgi:FkbM family methyltransferase
MLQFAQILLYGTIPMFNAPHARRSVPPLWNRAVSRLVASYTLPRGRTRLRHATSPWLVGHLPCGAWTRVSGLVDAEWNFLQGASKEDITENCIKPLLHPGSVFVDVGANVGYFTLLASTLGARVVAYEPTPSVFARLKENVALNGFQHAELVNAAVMDKPGTLSLHLSGDDPEANSLFGDDTGDRGPCVHVPAISLDEDLAARGIDRVDLLKIDAEGAEPFVLDGASRLLSSPHPPVIIVEVNAFTLKCAGLQPSDILSRLEAHGYNHTEMESGIYKGSYCGNILATPRSASV